MCDKIAAEVEGVNPAKSSAARVSQHERCKERARFAPGTNRCQRGATKVSQDWGIEAPEIVAC